MVNQLEHKVQLRMLFKRFQNGFLLASDGNRQVRVYVWEGDSFENGTQGDNAKEKRNG